MTCYIGYLLSSVTVWSDSYFTCSPFLSFTEADSEADQMTTSTLDAGGIAVHNDHGDYSLFDSILEKERCTKVSKYHIQRVSHDCCL